MDRSFKVEDDEESYYTYHNPYYAPEKCGLEIVEVTSKPGMSYEFDLVVLWKDKTTGDFFWLRDMGCSCPSPYEDVCGLADLNAGLEEYEKAKAACAKPHEW